MNFMLSSEANEILEYYQTVDFNIWWMIILMIRFGPVVIIYADSGRTGKFSKQKPVLHNVMP